MLPLSLHSHFIDISDRCTELETIATDWQNRKAGTKGLTPLGNQSNSFIVGLKGELIYARLVGLEHELCLAYKQYGDGGEDFRRSVDVKTTTGHPYLIENKTVNPDLKSSKNPRNWAKYFVKVKLNPEQTGGWVMGWATKEQLLNAPVRELHQGQGERYCLHDTNLNPYDTDINYLHHLHALAGNISEPALAEFLTRRRIEAFKVYHEAYQERIKANGV